MYIAEFDANLRDAIKRLYAAFAPYPEPTALTGSPHKDIGAMERALRAAPLRALSPDQIGPYAGSALLTVGSIADYKHYLPRIIEVSVAHSAHVGTDAPIIAERLKRAGWRSWPAKEQLSLRSVFAAAWSWSVDQHPGYGPSAEEWLCGIAALEEPVELVLSDWSARSSQEAILQSAWLATSAVLLRSPEEELAYWSFVSAPVRTVVADWVSGEERVEVFLRIIDKLPEHDRQYIDQALEAVGHRRLH